MKNTFELEERINTLEQRLYSNYDEVWEWIEVLRSTLQNNGMIVTLPLKAKYDPKQKKLRSIFEE